MTVQHPAPLQPAPPPYGPHPRNGAGTAAFVLGLVGAVFSLIPFIGVIAWFLVIPGLVLALVGLARASAGTANNRGMSIAGLVLSVVGLLVCFAYAATFAAAFSGVATSAATGSARPAATGTAAPAATLPAGTLTSGTYLVGQEIQPGSYHTSGPSSDSIVQSCVWSRNSDTSGELSGIIANHISTGPDTVTVRAGDVAVEFSGSCTWTKVG